MLAAGCRSDFQTMPAQQMLPSSSAETAKRSVVSVTRLVVHYQTFVSRGCVNPVTGTGCTSVDIGVSANVALVDKFCYLGDMLSVDGDADAAVETRIRIGWNKFKQLVPLLTNKDISFIVRGSGEVCSQLKIHKWTEKHAYTALA